MDDLIVRWCVGRATDTFDDDGRQQVEPALETVRMSIDGVLRRLRSTLTEEAVVAVTVQIGDNDLVSDRVRQEVASH